MKNIETPDKKHLDGFMSELQKGSYLIPDFQREFVWEPWDVLDLVKSIFMDYYIGTLLLWKIGENNAEILACEPIYGYKGKNDSKHIVLDGQQRLTSLYLAFFGTDIHFPNRKSKCYFFVKVDQLIEENFEDAFYYSWESYSVNKFLNNKELQFKKRTIPLSIIGQGNWGVQDWIREYTDYWQNPSNYDQKNQDKVEQIKQTQKKHSNKLYKYFKELMNEYHISYIELDRDIPIGKVCDIFTKINSKGVNLSIFDLLNAILRPQDIYLKTMWREIEGSLDYTDPNRIKIHILMVMSILKQSYCSPRYLYYLVPGSTKTIKLKDGKKKDIILVNDKDEFNNSWNEAVAIIEKTVSMIKNPRDFGAINKRFVPYSSIIPILSAINRYIVENDYPNLPIIKRKIRKWYWASIFTQNYSSAVESQSAKDFNDLKKWFVDDSKTPDAVIQFQNSYKDMDLIQETKQGSAIYNAIFNILVLKSALDWNTMDLPEYSNLDDHHIVPKSYGKEFAGDKINSILNKTPLSENTNRIIIRDQAPNIYLKEMIDKHGRKEVVKVLKTHLISEKALDILLRDNFSKDDYYEFIEERRSTIIDEIEHLVFKDFETDTIIDYIEIINNGENDKTEFKSSMRWSYKASMPDKKLEEIIAKSIVSMLNTEGGILFVGVDDNKEVIGIEQDIKAIGKKEEDGYLLHLRNVIENYIGNSLWHNIHYKIVTIKEKRVCIVDIGKSNRPVFLKINNEEKFVIRTMNASKLLSISESLEYIKNHFNE